MSGLRLLMTRRVAYAAAFVALLAVIVWLITPGHAEDVRRHPSSERPYEQGQRPPAQQLADIGGASVRREEIPSLVVPAGEVVELKKPGDPRIRDYVTRENIGQGKSEPMFDSFLDKAYGLPAACTVEDIAQSEFNPRRIDISHLSESLRRHLGVLADRFATLAAASSAAFEAEIRAAEQNPLAMVVREPRGRSGPLEGAGGGSKGHSSFMRVLDDGRILRGYVPLSSTENSRAIALQWTYTWQGVLGYIMDDLRAARALSPVEASALHEKIQDRVARDAAVSELSRTELMDLAIEGLRELRSRPGSQRQR